MSRITLATAAAAWLIAAPSFADPLNCDLSAFTAVPGLAASAANDTLTITWDGDSGQSLRMRFVIVGGTPTIRELAVRRDNGAWTTVGSNITPDVRIVSGIRRVTMQQLWPLRQNGIEITEKLIDEIKWESFWDAPLMIPGAEWAHGNATPPPEPFLNHPGLPRKPDEVKRAAAVYRADRCTVKTNGARVEVTFPGVELGVFSGRLEFVVFKGSNLVRQTVYAKTDEPSVAFKYDAGWKGLTADAATRVVWRDIFEKPQDVRLTSVTASDPVPVKAGNRVLVAESKTGSIAVFPPPHSFFWSREVETNLGFVYYRKDGPSSLALGIRHAEAEEDTFESGAGDIRYNFTLYSARPGTWQQLTAFFYPAAAPATATLDAALAFTRRDRFKPLAGYQVMATHFHTSLARRLATGGNEPLAEFELMKAAGVNIFAPIDGGRGAGADRLKSLHEYYQAARKHSTNTFLIMPNEEDTSGYLGGHSDFIVPKPIYWKFAERGDPFVTKDPVYGTVYSVAGPDEMMEMARRENVLVFMPHPRSKGSTGFPDAIKDSTIVRHEHFRGIGWRWGMGLDRSETQLCEHRCQSVLDDMNNWVSDLPTPPKYAMAITETYRKQLGDDIYANNPVNYVRLDRLPGTDDWSPIVTALRRGDYFVSSGEVLIPSYAVEGTGAKRTIAADVEWTFPLEYAEVVWGDGHTTKREIIPVTHLPPFGQHRFSIPFDATGKKWVRFAVWDIAGNGALVQPMKLEGRSPTDRASRDEQQ